MNAITLYPGIAFSPQAMLTSDITASDTIIYVSNLNCFPSGPNLATIGLGEGGETILYTGKSNGALIGCSRGVEGIAKPWKSGEIIGRNFTAKDHNDIITLLNAIENAIKNLPDDISLSLTAIQADISDLKNRINGMNPGDITSIKNELAILNLKIQNIETNSSNKADISELQVIVNDLKSKVDIMTETVPMTPISNTDINNIWEMASPN